MSAESVKPDVRHIPFRRLGASEVHLRYFEDEPDLRQFLGERPRHADDLLRRAPLAARRLVDRGELARALEAYAVRHEAPDAVIANARALAEPTTFVVVTGQQPGLFGGPLYSIHKAATAVRLARELSARPGAPRVLPLFWNHSDDHDLDEVNRAFIVNANHDVQRLRLDLDTTGGEPIREVAIGRAMDPVLNEIGGLLPDSDFRAWALDIFRPRRADEHFGDPMARLLFSMFGAEGLLIIEPRDLPASAFDVLPRWCDAADTIRNRIRAVTEHLSDIGLDVTMDPSATQMFHISGGVRVPLSDVEPYRRPQDLSPGVLLRPLWQDACLPSIGFVVGPGELAYLAIAGPLYKTLGVPQPVLVPRASLTLVEPSIAKPLDKFNLDITDLDRDPLEIAASLDAGAEGTVEEAIGALREQIADELRRLGPLVAESEPQMVPGIERVQGKVDEELDKLAQKLRKAREARAGTGLRQVRRIVANLRPRGRLQERVLTVLPYLVRHGAALGPHIVDAADPFATSHGVVEL